MSPRVTEAMTERELLIQASYVLSTDDRWRLLREWDRMCAVNDRCGRLQRALTAIAGYQPDTLADGEIVYLLRAAAKEALA